MELTLSSLSLSAVKIRPKEGDMYFDVVAVVDPVTRDAQKLAPLLTVSRSVSFDQQFGLNQSLWTELVHRTELPWV